jgi:putative membrane protein insertion efficiency factor
MKRLKNSALNCVRMAMRLLVQFYQGSISLWLGGNCRFYPSCSEYALEAIETKSPIEALRLIARRLSQCHPLGSAGFDPVPLSERKK